MNFYIRYLQRVSTVSTASEGRTCWSRAVSTASEGRTCWSRGYIQLTLAMNRLCQISAKRDEMTRGVRIHTQITG